MPKKCPKCYSSKIKKDGINQSWNQKLKCKKCFCCFVQRRMRKWEPQFRTNSWFEKYITEWYSARQIADQSGKQEYLVRLDIQRRLDINTLLQIDEFYVWAKYVMIDGYHLPWGKILLVYYEYILGKVLWFSITNSECKPAIVRDLLILRDSFWYEFRAFIMDGSPSILSAIRSVYPEAIIQRCLVHIQRQVFSYITKHPKSEAWKGLLWIMSYLILADPELFPLKYTVWKEKYFSFLSEKSISLATGRWIFTHSSLRKAMKHIENALPYMYQSYKHSDWNIERSTNKLEGYFWVFTNEGINQHKWLSEERLYSFVALWIYLRNCK